MEKGAGSARDARGSSGTEEHTLLQEHLAALGQPVPGNTARSFERTITDALAAGTTPDTIRTACAEWRRRPGAKPGLLPHLIGDAVKATAQLDPLADPDVARWVAEQEAAQR